MKSWKVRQVTEFLFKCCQQLSQIMVQFGLFGGIYIWYLSIEELRSHQPMPEVHYQPFDHQSLRIYSTIKYFLAHQIFLCWNVKIFSRHRSNTFSRRAIWDLSGQKLNKFSTNYNVSNNGKILWKCQIWFWLFLPDKAESRASEEEERNFFRLSTTTSHPLTPSSILTRTSL